ncbi:MAG: hypothetical protein AAF721_03490 [Myxococcota bacterium]
MDDNDVLLDWVEEIGGGYVWEDDVKAVTLMETAIDAAQARKLGRLRGVGQLALDAERLSVDALRGLAAIEGLASLVLRNAALSSDEVAGLAALGPEVEVVAE